MIFQGTLQRPIEIEGIGLHGGEKSRVCIAPAPPNTGIRFTPHDECADESGVLAHYSNLHSTNNAITIGSEEFSIKTIEHFMAVFYVYNITNAVVTLRGSEMPILDGSSIEIVRAVEEAGVKVQNDFQRLVYIPYPIWIEHNGNYLIALPSDAFKITYTIDFTGKSEAIGTQTAHYTVTPPVFKKSIAPARTFGLVEERELLRSNHLALGGSLDNALHFTRDGLVNDELRFYNECARHKILDLIGDLSLIGHRMVGHFIAHKGGHSLHLQFVRKIDRVARRSGGGRRIAREVVRRKEVQFNRFIRKISYSGGGAY